MLAAAAAIAAKEAAARDAAEAATAAHLQQHDPLSSLLEASQQHPFRQDLAAIQGGKLGAIFGGGPPEQNLGASLNLGIRISEEELRQQLALAGGASSPASTKDNDAAVATALMNAAAAAAAAASAPPFLSRNPLLGGGGAAQDMEGLLLQSMMLNGTLGGGATAAITATTTTTATNNDNPDVMNSLHNHDESMIEAEEKTPPCNQHFFVIDRNGTILSATETVTGFPANSLLLTSAFDGIHEDDMVGLDAIRTHFWNQGVLNVGAYVRRKTEAQEGQEWIWLLSKVVALVDNPVPGFVLQEVEVHNEEAAQEVSQTIRVAALLHKVVRSAMENSNTRTPTGFCEAGQATCGAGKTQVETVAKSTNGGGVIPGIAEDAAALLTLLESGAANGLVNDLNDRSLNPLKELIQVAASGGTVTGNATTTAALSGDGSSNNSNSRGDEQSNPLSLWEYLRAGTRLDLSKIHLSTSELRMVVCVLAGRMRIETVGNELLKDTPGEGEKARRKWTSNALDGYRTEYDCAVHHHHKRTPKGTANGKMSSSHGSNHRPHHHNSRTMGRHRSRSFGDDCDMPSSSLSLTDSPHRAAVHSWGAGLERRHFTQSKAFPQFQSLRSLDNGCGRSVSSPLPRPSPRVVEPPAISVLNLSFTNLGTTGMEQLSEVLYADNSLLKTLDLSFCSLDERGILAFCGALKKRKQRGLPSLQGLVLTGNSISYKAAKELGIALSRDAEKPKVQKRSNYVKLRVMAKNRGGYEDDDELDSEEEEMDDDALFNNDSSQRRGRRMSWGKSNGSSRETTDKDGDNVNKNRGKDTNQGCGLQLLHLGGVSIAAESLTELLLGLGADSPIRELGIPSNGMGLAGATRLVHFLEGKVRKKGKQAKTVMPNLDRLDLSNNELGNEGTAKLARAIAKRKNVNIVDLRLSSNDIGAGGIETILNRLINHNLVQLSLDNNAIRDRGCQLVAASVPSMHHLSRLNLCFNEIGSRGVTALMRALVSSDSITYIGLSGNVIKVSGAVAMSYALSQHPRLAELEVDNCCLSQVAQCHLVIGIICNRLVPMKRLKGFNVAPPLVAIGALDLDQQNLSNEECFRIKRDVQMRLLVEVIARNRQRKMANSMNLLGNNNNNNNGESGFADDSLDDDNEASIVSAQRSQWLRNMPFDEDELTDLRKYFYDVDGGESGEGLRGSDGLINLKRRGDLLAALDSHEADEIRDTAMLTANNDELGNVGLAISPSDEEDNLELDGNDSDNDLPVGVIWASPKIERKRQAEDSQDDMATAAVDDKMLTTPPPSGENDGRQANSRTQEGLDRKRRKDDDDDDGSDQMKKPCRSKHHGGVDVVAGTEVVRLHRSDPSSASSISNKSVLSRSGSDRSNMSATGGAGAAGGADHQSTCSKTPKARIATFPQFAAELDALMANAQAMMDSETDADAQDRIAQQYAEESLVLLRNLRYHCMECGLDGWRRNKEIRRKVLIVDDSIVTRKLVQRAFEKANFIVDTAENGMEGVMKLKESIYDIAFMDIAMPVMNGFDATKALREWEDQVRPGVRQPICALTATYVDDFERSELMKFKEAGIDVMESKPCSIPRLFKVVDDVSPMFSDLSINMNQMDVTTFG